MSTAVSSSLRAAAGAKFKRAKAAEKGEAPPKRRSFVDLGAAFTALARAATLSKEEGVLLKLLLEETFENCRRLWASHEEPPPKRPWDSGALLKVVNMCANVQFSDEEPPVKVRAKLAVKRTHQDETSIQDSPPFNNLSPRIRSDDPRPMKDADYCYHGPHGWFPAELLFKEDHPRKPRERWSWLLATR